jgi:hypothetical protein
MHCLRQCAFLHTHAKLRNVRLYRRHGHSCGVSLQSVLRNISRLC